MKVGSCKYDSSEVVYKNSGSKSVKANDPEALKEAVAG